ncbi:hypothetical protein H4582DRAFT_2056722 [Lactarius indigo]|nr:hypothetical protein H4582DRAFT_2056722 [Lactarius indigo]
MPLSMVPVVGDQEQLMHRERNPSSKERGCHLVASKITVTPTILSTCIVVTSVVCFVGKEIESLMMAILGQFLTLSSRKQVLRSPLELSLLPVLESERVLCRCLRTPFPKVGITVSGRPLNVDNNKKRALVVRCMSFGDAFTGRTNNTTGAFEERPLVKPLTSSEKDDNKDDMGRKRAKSAAAASSGCEPTKTQRISPGEWMSNILALMDNAAGTLAGALNICPVSASDITTNTLLGTLAEMLNAIRHPASSATPTATDIHTDAMNVIEEGFSDNELACAACCIIASAELAGTYLTIRSREGSIADYICLATSLGDFRTRIHAKAKSTLEAKWREKEGIYPDSGSILISAKLASTIETLENERAAERLEMEEMMVEAGGMLEGLERRVDEKMAKVNKAIEEVEKQLQVVQSELQSSNDRANEMLHNLEVDAATKDTAE